MSEITIEQRDPRERRPQLSAIRAIDWGAAFRDRHFVGAACYLLACLLLGGATASGQVPNGLLQMTAVGLLLWLVLEHRTRRLDRPERQLVALALAAIAVPLVQIVPLPPALWSALPGRQPIVEGYALLGQPLPWLPISFTPERTVAAMLSLLPPLAMLLLVLRTGPDGRAGLALLVIAVAVGSMLLGLAQLRAGRDSPLYFYSPTTLGAPVAFFANVNHHATLVLATIPLVGLLVARVGGVVARLGVAIGPIVVLVAAAVLLLVSLVMTRSLAGTLLAAPALVGAMLVALPALPTRTASRWRRFGLFGAGALTIAAVVAIGFTLAGGIKDVLGDPVEPVSRPDVLKATLGVATAYLPWGSGLGSFDQLYPTALPIGSVTRTFVNHAHNDYAELLLETGLIGFAVLAALLAWIAINGFAALRTATLADAPRRAGAVIVAIVLLHSLADYPVRTHAIMAVAAMGLALLASRPREPAPRR